MSSAISKWQSCKMQLKIGVINTSQLLLPKNKIIIQKQHSSLPLHHEKSIFKIKLPCSFYSSHDSASLTFFFSQTIGNLLSYFASLKRDDKVMEATVVDDNGTETRHIIITTIGDKNGQPKQTIS